MRRVPANTFDRPWLVLCEGDADKKLIDRLMVDRNISDRDRFQTQFPDRAGGRGGRGQFGRYLDNAYITAPTFQFNVEDVIIISDNDESPANSFKEVQNELQKAKFPIPVAERQVARAEGYPAVVVVMIPNGVPGNLETLCIEAAYTKWSVEAPLDDFISLVPANEFSLSHQYKSRMQCILAATCATNPAVSLGYIWNEPAEYHLPIDHSAFDDLAAFIRGFGAFLAGS